MKVLFYSSRAYEIPHLTTAGNNTDDNKFIEDLLNEETAQHAAGFEAISIFTADDASAPVLIKLSQAGVKFITVRATGYDNVDLNKAEELGIRVANVPAYSPYAIAEHAVALILAIKRNLVVADRQVHCNDFTTNALVGSELHGKTVGIIGTGSIGSVFAGIIKGFGCNLLGNDIVENEDLKIKTGISYTSLTELCKRSEIISIHCSLNAATKHMLNKSIFSLMRNNVIVINTGRGGCIHTADVIEALTSGKIGFYGADVYEHERGIFFNDRSKEGINDEMLSKLLALPNVLMTPHQGFATNEALTNIADTTFYNILRWDKGEKSDNELT